MKKQFLVGADPECFVVNKKTGEVVDAIPFIPGYKDNPYWITGLGDGYAIQTDNILAEFNIPACRTREEFVSSIRSMKGVITGYLLAQDKNLGILCAATQDVDEKYLQSDQARLFGCEPDYCVYTMEENSAPGVPKGYRTAGFHIHCSIEDSFIDNVRSCKAIKFLDLFLGIPSVIIDTDPRRRGVYGKAGAMRLKVYGPEYRTPSSYMLNDEFLGYMYDQTITALDKVYEDEDSSFEDSIDWDYVRKTINDGNITEAEKIVKQFNIAMPCVESSVT